MTTRLGLYCTDCQHFSLRAGGDGCPSCRSQETTVRRGLVCPSCRKATPTDDPNWRRCLECDAPLPTED